MRYLEVRNVSRGSQVASRVGIADRWWQRARGLIGRPPLGPGEGLLLVPCHAIHMLGVRYAIDIAFLDDECRVVALYPRLEPGVRSRTKWHGEARYTLELSSGALAASHTAVGDRLEWGTAPTREVVSDLVPLKEAVV